MSKRLHVLLPDKEMDEIRRFAHRERLPVGEWVRRVLREARSERPVHEPTRKLGAIRKAAAHSFPTGGIEQMLAEIERGYQQ
jgi:hypothetical protein